MNRIKINSVHEEITEIEFARENIIDGINKLRINKSFIKLINLSRYSILFSQHCG